MKFFAGFITATLISLILVISAWLYFDFPIQTNDETETYNPPQEVQQQKYNDYVESQDNPTVTDDAGQQTQAHNEAGTNNYEYAKEHSLIQEDK